MAPRKPKTETPEQQKIREAQEIVRAAKEAESKAWQEKWKAQQADPEYQRKQAERWAKSEERSRTRAINKENKVLADIAKVSARYQANFNKWELHETAVHEACHAVTQELLTDGVREVNITPRSSERKNANGATEQHSRLGSSSSAGTTIGKDNTETALWNIAVNIAPEVGLPKAFPEDCQEFLHPYDPDYSAYEDEDDFDDAKYAYESQFGGDRDSTKTMLELINLSGVDGWRFTQKAKEIVIKMFADEKIWAAVEEVADALLTDKTLSGNDVKLIVRKHTMPYLGVQFDAGKQMSFHYRKNRYGTAPYILGIGVTTGTASYSLGYHLAEPQYVRDVVKANAQPVPFPVMPVIVPLKNITDGQPTGKVVSLTAPLQMTFFTGMVVKAMTLAGHEIHISTAPPTPTPATVAAPKKTRKPRKSKVTS